jgi:hypothetical protein
VIFSAVSAAVLRVLCGKKLEPLRSLRNSAEDAENCLCVGAMIEFINTR